MKTLTATQLKALADSGATVRMPQPEPPPAPVVNVAPPEVKVDVAAPEVSVEAPAVTVNVPPSTEQAEALKMLAESLSSRPAAWDFVVTQRDRKGNIQRLRAVAIEDSSS